MAGFQNTMHPVVEPVETPDPFGHGTEFTHPSFAQIGAYRISGGRVLYGSDFQHNSFVRIRVKSSVLKRDLSHDWHHGNDTMIELDVSEAQWASFLSGMNIGDGTPCTLNFVQGVGPMPDLPLPSRTDQFQAEADAKLLDAIAKIREVMEKVPAARQRELALVIQDIEKNLPFVAKSFGEHMERSVEKARVEIHGYMNGALRQAGLEHLQGQAPLTLEDRTDEEPK